MSDLNLTTFFAYVRKSPFGGRLTQSQIDGLNAIIDAFYEAGQENLKYLAYILATAFHETGGKMQPVREGFASTDAGARKAVAARKYAAPDPVTKQVYYGRGLVQITWAENYKAMGKILGLSLYEHPDIALQPDVSARILIEGMLRGNSGRGDFTGKCLEDYFAGDKEDPVGARRIINGNDKAQLIATYYKAFLESLKHAQSAEASVEIDERDAAPDAPNLMKDKTTLGTISAVAGSGAVGALTSINSPWAFAAFLVLAIGAVLFLTGRLQIVKKAGA